MNDLLLTLLFNEILDHAKTQISIEEIQIVMIIYILFVKTYLPLNVLNRFSNVVFLM